MAIYNKAGTALYAAYDIDGESLNTAYDIGGDEVFESEYNHYDNEYQHSILLARDAWEQQYRADSDVVPLVLTTDQHSYLDATHGKPLYDYLSLALKWSEVSASLNMGDVCSNEYSKSTLDTMIVALSAISTAKQINVAGNHDVIGLTTDADALDAMFDTYFNNSAYNDNSRYQHRGFETMIDEAHKIRYVCIGSWYFYDDVNYHYRISTGAMAWLIETLETQDDYDVIILSHIQPSVGSLNEIFPAVDGRQYETVQIRTFSGTACVGYDVPINQIIAARKNKTSGTITDAEGVVHSYNFSGCTSDILCSIHGHTHIDWINYLGGIPAIVFDAYRYDKCPFYLFNVDRTNECVDVWKIENDGTIQTYSVPFEEHVNPCTAITLDKASATVAVGGTVTITPTFTTQYQDDGTFPHWVAIWSTSSSSVATVENGVVTGVSAGTCTITASCGSVTATCTVTVS